jgi:phosphoglycolate phosphatase-like HAD superfamily hydrolase
MYQSANTLPRPAIVIFDMDGTLVDITRSYREATPVAADRYLRLLGLVPPPLTGDVYDLFKQMTGFNDDWDLTTGLLELLVAGLPPALPLSAHIWPGQEALIAALRAAVAPLAGMTPFLPDLAALIEPVRAAGGGLAGLRQLTRRHNAHLVWRDGNAATTDLVQRLFSEAYLGEQLFADCYGFPARYQRGPGLIESERLLVSPVTLEALSRRGRLGIATGRTRFEAAYTLKLMGLGRFFGAVTTMTDALEAQTPGGESLLKPHPYLLQRAAEALDPGGRLVAAYLGDAPDDVVAARRADGRRRWLAIAIAASPDLRQDYHNLGADLVLGHPDELLGSW